MSGIKKIQNKKDILARKKAEESETQELTVLLNKFRKDDILTSIIETPSDTTRKSKKNKQILIKEAIHFLTEKFSDLDELILYLQLKYMQILRKERNWNTLEIKDAKKFKRPDLTSEKVSNCMLKYFNRYGVSCKIFSEKMSDCIWTAMLLKDDKPQKSPTFFLAHMRLSAVFYHNLKAKYSLIAEKVLRKTYRGTDIKELNTIHNYAENLQGLNIKTYRSLCKNSFPPEKNKNIKIVNDLQNNKVTEKVKYQTVPSCVLQNTFVVQGKRRTGVDSGLQSEYKHSDVRDKTNASDLQNDFVANNVREKITILDNLQSNLVTHDVREKTKTADDNQNEFVTENVRDKPIILNKLQSSLINQDVTKKTKTLDNLQSGFTTKNVKNKTIILNKLQSSLVPHDDTENAKDKNIILDDSQSSFVTHDIRAQTKTPSNLHSRFVAQNIKGTTNILGDLETIIIQDVKDKTKVPRDLQKGSEIQKAKSSNDVKEDFQVIRNETKATDDFEQDSAYVREVLPSIVNENKRDLRRKRKYVRKTFEDCDEPLAKNLKYIVKSDSFGTWENTDSYCVITFQGTNILKGFGKLVNSGMADSPLPDYLSKEPKTGKNKFVLAV